MTDVRKRWLLEARDNTGRGTRSAKRNFNALEEGANRLKFALAGVIGAVGVGGMVGMIRATLQAQDQIQKLNQRLGISTEALSQYQHVAKLTGVSFQTLTVGMQRMTRRISEAAAGTGEAKKALAELGLSAQRLNQLAPEDQFEIMADALMGVENSADRVRLAMRLFDTEGVSLLQTMQGGSEAIQRMREEADRLGLTLDKNAATQAAKANDAFTRLGATFRGAANQIVIALGPSLEAMAKWLGEYIPKAVDITRAAWDGLMVLLANIGASIVDFLLAPLEMYFKLVEKLPGALGDSARANREWIEQIRDDMAMITSGEGLAASQTGVFGQFEIALPEDKFKDQMDMREEQLTEAAAMEENALAEHLARMNELQAMHDQRVLERTQQVADKRMAAEQKVRDHKRSMLFSTLNLAVGFLNELGKKNKAAAIAAIALDKGLAIAEVIINTARAVSLVTAQLGVAAGPAIAAVKAMGAAQVALIAATGLHQAANVGGGDGGGGTLVGSVGGEPATAAPGVLGGGASQTLNLKVEVTGGVIDSEETQLALVDAIRKGLDRGADLGVSFA